MEKKIEITVQVKLVKDIKIEDSELLVTFGL